VKPVVSVVIVSFNTKNLLRECLESLQTETAGIPSEVFVVDNLSLDGSADLVELEFPQVRLIRSDRNLGFAAANNRAFELATGQYVVLLNSDAFLHPGALRKAIHYMDRDPGIGLGGARLVGRNGSWQPSARLFPSLLNDFLTLSGLAAKYPESAFFGRFDRTWADQNLEAEVDWVPGAFSIIRRSVLQRIGFFDENFFLYYEEVDLCRRIQFAGYSILYWPDVKVIHLGGESSKTVQTLTMSRSGAQLGLWRMRSEFLYYRKHHGSGAWMVKQMEECWHRLRVWKNRSAGDAEQKAKAEESEATIALLHQAWRDTCGGRVSPPRPW
jgi:GT2 family glycosyltransferase